LSRRALWTNPRLYNVKVALPMTASIAHEINQPLAAIVANGNAGLRWLAREDPNLDEVQKALQRIVDDGRSRIVEHRQGRVLGKRKSRPEVSGGWRSDAGAGIVRPCQ